VHSKSADLESDEKVFDDAKVDLSKLSETMLQIQVKAKVSSLGVSAAQEAGSQYAPVSGHAVGSRLSLSGNVGEAAEAGEPAAVGTGRNADGKQASLPGQALRDPGLMRGSG
jgi:hypothetical protein